MKEIIKWNEKEVKYFTDMQVEKIKALKDCHHCNLLLEHIDMYKDIIHNLMEEWNTQKQSNYDKTDY